MSGKSRDWLHQIEGKEAEKLLKAQVPGTFLVRPSKANPGDFSLSVFRGGGTFGSLSDLVDYYVTNPEDLKEKGGAPIKLVSPLKAKSVTTTDRWFHGPIKGKDCEKLLKEHGDLGSFLVRESSSKPGSFVISVLDPKGAGKVTHVVINNRGGNNPMVEKSGNVISLSKPLNATKIRAADIETRVMELSKETDPVYEFEELQQMELDHAYERTEGQKLVNKSKNRYKNILPFNYCRIKLEDVDKSVEGADYINASTITGEVEGPGNNYIACQGCLKATVPAFWQMVWEQNNRIIVMTTAVVERGKNKCAPYWPRPEEPITYGDYTVTPHSGDDFEREERDFFLRKMTLVKEGTGEPGREIFQYHFKAWPDHGVPRNPDSVLDFLMIVNKQMGEIRAITPALGHVVVHCSAGIGRTGTFIVIDILLKLMEAKGHDVAIDIQQTIHRVRGQRPGMIQTEGQYRFIYEAVAQHIGQRRIIASGGSVANPELYCNLGGGGGGGGGGGPAVPPKQVVSSIKGRARGK
eukprot:gene2272-3250_t